MYFTVSDGTLGNELWKSDGTSAGTVVVKDIWPGAGGSWSTELAMVDGILHFSANDGIHGEELWRSDGTPGGTVMVADIVPWCARPCISPRPPPRRARSYGSSGSRM